VEELSSEFTIEKLEKGEKKMKYPKASGDERVQEETW
jgi:hypothetical protein